MLSSAEIIVSSPSFSDANPVVIAVAVASWSLPPAATLICCSRSWTPWSAATMGSVNPCKIPCEIPWMASQTSPMRLNRASPFSFTAAVTWSNLGTISPCRCHCSARNWSSRIWVRRVFSSIRPMSLLFEPPLRTDAREPMLCCTRAPIGLAAAPATPPAAPPSPPRMLLRPPPKPPSSRSNRLGILSAIACTCPATSAPLAATAATMLAHPVTVASLICRVPLTISSRRSPVELLSA